jgi:hypothetical protein
VHCRQRLPSAPHLGPQFQAALAQFQQTIAATQQQRQEVRQRLSHCLQRLRERNIELEQVQILHAAAASDTNRALEQRQAIEAHDHLLQQWMLKSKGQDDEENDTDRV